MEIIRSVCNFRATYSLTKTSTSPWGNVELVNSPEAFEEYMEYAGTDYVYAESGYIGTDSWEWSYGLLRDLISDGVLTDFF